MSDERELQAMVASHWRELNRIAVEHLLFHSGLLRRLIEAGNEVAGDVAIELLGRLLEIVSVLTPARHQAERAKLDQLSRRAAHELGKRHAREERAAERLHELGEVSEEEGRAIHMATTKTGNVNIGTREHWERRWSELYALAFAAQASKFGDLYARAFADFAHFAPPEAQPDPRNAKAVRDMLDAAHKKAAELAECAAVLASEGLRREMKYYADRIVPDDG